MESNLVTRRLIEAGALFLIGNGIIGLLTPRSRSLVWHMGPQLVKAATEELGEHRNVSRAVSGAQIALGLALFSSQRD